MLCLIFLSFSNDPEGYSLWKVAYKYPDELTQVFMSSNLIGGYFSELAHIVFVRAVI